MNCNKFGLSPDRLCAAIFDGSSDISDHRGGTCIRYSLYPWGEMHPGSLLASLNLYLVHLLSAFVSEWDVKALFNKSTIYIAPLPEGAPWRCRLGCEHDTLRLLLLRPHAGTQPIQNPVLLPAGQALSIRVYFLPRMLISNFTVFQSTIQNVKDVAYLTFERQKKSFQRDLF